MSISGDTLAIGATQDDSSAVDSGAVYIYTRIGSSWNLQAKITTSDTINSSYFGSSISISGDTVVVGNLQNCAYVFSRNNGQWTQQQKLTVPDVVAGDQFGSSVSISGETMIIGASQDSIVTSFDHSGSAYIFTLENNVWVQQAKLISSNPMANSFFGISVSIQNDTAIIGADSDRGGADYSGSAYIFTRSGGKWSQEQKLTASDAACDDNFGRSVAVSDDTVAIGAPGNDIDGKKEFGSAYVFRSEDGGWIQEDEFSASDSAEKDTFGTTVAISGDIAVVGIPNDDIHGKDEYGYYQYKYDAGSACVYTRSGSAWILQSKLTASDAMLGNQFGRSVAVSGNTIIIGSGGHPHVSGDICLGSAYVYEYNGSKWIQQAKLFTSSSSDNNSFGCSVSISGDTVIVGATGVFEGGSAFIFKRNGSTWSSQQVLTSSDVSANKQFGWSVAVLDDTAIVGAPLDSAKASFLGAAYVFKRSGTVWTQQQKLIPSDVSANNYFGNTISISNNSLIIGANSNPGSVYVFALSGSEWSQTQKLVASTTVAGDHFGGSVSLSGNIAVIGADASSIIAGNSGIAYLFENGGTRWSEKVILAGADAKANDHFGTCVATDQGRIIIGAPSKDDPEANSGAAYVFDLDPVVLEFSANDGASSTTNQTVRLNNTCANLPTECIASESSGFIGASWQPYSVSPNFTLSSGNGIKTIYFKARNPTGESSTVSDTITLREGPNVSSFSIKNGAASTSDRIVLLNNTCTNSPTQYMASESLSFNGATWKAYSVAPSFTLTSSNGVKTVYYKVKNATGESAVVSDSIMLYRQTRVGPLWVLFE